MTQATQNTGIWALIKATLQEWSDDNAARLAAALAYYTIFSIAPLLVIVLAIVGFVLGPEAAQGQLIDQIESFTGDAEAAAMIQTLIENVAQPRTGLFAVMAGVVGLLFGASGGFGELKSSLNQIWDVEPSDTGGAWGYLLNRLLALAMVLGSGFLLLASLILSTAVTAATGWLDELSPNAALISQGVNFVVAFGVTVLVFALIYKVLPDVSITWRDIWIGAIATALLFSIGRLLISFYLGYSSPASAYGAAGSLAILLLWIYYSAQIFFLGAEFTQVYARTHGSRQDEHTLIEGSVSTTPTESPAPAQPVRSRPSTRPLVELATAVGVIAAVSLINLVREPFRRR